VTWATVVSTVATAINAVAVNGANLVAVGDAGIVLVSTDSGATWAPSGAASGTTEDLYGVVWNSDITEWVIVGYSTTILLYDQVVTFQVGTADTQVDLGGVAFAPGGLMIAAGSGSITLTTELGFSWSSQESGASSSFLHAIEYFDSRFVAVGAEGKVLYSSTGSGVRTWDRFVPVSEIYRSIAFARFKGYMLYIGMREYENGEWLDYPRRIRNASPGTATDFDPAFGAWFADLPGDGIIYAGVAIEGGIVLGEQNQISLITDGGSIQTPWQYNDNYGQGLQLISNFTSFNGAGFGICTDGLIYRADYNSCRRINGAFDLTQFDDFNPGSELVTIQFDPMTQKLVVFRPESPYTLYLVDDESGSVTELGLPTFTVGSDVYTPRAVVIEEGRIGGIKVCYATDTVVMGNLVTLDFQYYAAVTGIDDADLGEDGRFHADMITGCFRIQKLGIRGDLSEILVRTNCDPNSSSRPMVAVGIKAEPEDDWRYGGKAAGTIAVDGVAVTITGTGTAFTNTIAAGDGASTVFDIPWLVEKATRVYWKQDAPGTTETDLAYTKSGARQITLALVLANGGDLIVEAGPYLPMVEGDVNDLLELEDGTILFISGITDYNSLTSGYIPGTYSGAAEYITAKEMPAGDAKGDGKLIFGLGEGFDQLMVRILMVPKESDDGKWAKITGVELGYRPTGKELKTDGG